MTDPRFRINVSQTAKFSVKDIIRFNEKLNLLENGCLEFLGHVNHNGYCSFRVGTKMYRAHRFAWELYIGKIPDNLVLHHKCRNKKCCNINHLQIVTVKENLLLDETMASVNLSKTHCPKGHEYNSDNTRISKGKRSCVICNKIKLKLWNQKQAEKRGYTLGVSNENKTHCKNGHEFTPENTLILKNRNGRNCRECAKIRLDNFLKRKKEIRIGN